MPFSNKSVQKYVAKHDTTKKKVIVEEMIDLLPVLKKYKNQTQKALDVYKKAIELRQKYYSLGGRNFEKYVEKNLDELKIKYKTQVSIDEKGIIFQMIGQKLKNKEYKFLARIDFVISPKKRVFPKLGQHISELIVIEAKTTSKERWVQTEWTKGKKTTPFMFFYLTLGTDYPAIARFKLTEKRYIISDDYKGGEEDKIISYDDFSIFLRAFMGY